MNVLTQDKAQTLDLSQLKKTKVYPLLSDPEWNPELLAYKLVQGSLAKELSESPSRMGVLGHETKPSPPTALLLHGIMTDKTTWASLAKRLVEEHSDWQILLVDLRCHGDSISLSHSSDYSIPSVASDVLRLLDCLRLSPEAIIGHSYGGKVGLSLADLAVEHFTKPVKVWVLDTTPGTVIAGGNGQQNSGDLINSILRMPSNIPSRESAIKTLVDDGHPKRVAAWMATNLRVDKVTGGFKWAFDAHGVSKMFASYIHYDLWHMVEHVPLGVQVNFVRAEKSVDRWIPQDVNRILAAEKVVAVDGSGVKLHLLKDSGHWVHSDNLDGLVEILSPMFMTRQALFV